MNSISSAKTSRARLEEFTLRSIAAIFGGLSRLSGFVEKMRSILLEAHLSLVYFLLLTPMSSWQRRKSWGISTWNSEGLAGWHPNVESTFDERIFADSSTLDELSVVAKEGGAGEAELLMFRILQSSRFLARPPKGKQLSGDLYVMF